MIKFLVIAFTFFFCINAENDPLGGFNVVFKELVVGGKTIRISPFKGIGVVTINLCFKSAGEKLDPKDKEGLVSLLAKSMGESTESRSKEKLQAYSREHNVSVSVSTTDDNVTITGKCPSKKLHELFILIEDILLHSNFKVEDLNRIKKESISSTKQSMQNPDHHLEELINHTVLKNHPYGTSQQTYIKSLKNVSPDDLKTFKKKYFTQENLIVSACGEIDEDVLLKEVGALITKLPKDFKAQLPQDIKLSAPFEKYSGHFPVPQTLIHFLHEGISPQHPDFFALHIAIGCLSNAHTSILWKRVREEKGLTYGIGAGFSMKDHYNSFHIATSTKTKNVEETIQLIKNILKEVYENGFSDELVEVTKKSFLGNYKRSFASTSHIASRLTNYQLYSRPVDFHRILIEKISSLTPEQVNEAFKKFLKLDQFKIFTVGE